VYDFALVLFKQYCICWHSLSHLVLIVIVLQGMVTVWLVWLLQVTQQKNSPTLLQVHRVVATVSFTHVKSVKLGHQRHSLSRHTTMVLS